MKKEQKESKEERYQERRGNVIVNEDVYDREEVLIEVEVERGTLSGEGTKTRQRRKASGEKR